MIVYVAMINDRHTGPTPYVFSTPGAAIRCAKEYAEATAARHVGCEVEEEPIDGWLYHATFCVEGDTVWVLERVVDEESTPMTCCDLHGRNCEPPAELCCWFCTEASHPEHRDGSICSAPDLSGSAIGSGE